MWRERVAAAAWAVIFETAVSVVVLALLLGVGACVFALVQELWP